MFIFFHTSSNSTKVLYLDPLGGARSFQQKVMFDICFYFTCRANENFQDLKVDTSKVCVDYDSHLKYVKKVKDEMQKNHKETNSEIITGFMPEIPESMYCPVKSFQEYCHHLHPENEYLWQNPNEKSATNVWYTSGHVGQHTLEKFMPDLSEKCKLSRRYNNHSIRVTGSTILSRGGFNMKQIMSVTGHKSTNSLAVYQKVEKNEKLMIGLTLNAALLTQLSPRLELPDVLDERFAFQKPPLFPALPPPKNAKRKATHALGAPPTPTKNPAIEQAPVQVPGIEHTTPLPCEEEQNALVPALNLDDPDEDFMSDQELMGLLEHFESQSKQMQGMSSTTVQNTVNQTTTVRSPDIPTFNLCKIENINLNIVRK